MERYYSSFSSSVVSSETASVVMISPFSSVSGTGSAETSGMVVSTGGRVVSSVTGSVFLSVVADF